MKKQAKYFIYANRVDCDGFPEEYLVSWDNDVAESLDDAMYFTKAEDARCWILSDEAREWTNCTFFIRCEECQL